MKTSDRSFLCSLSLPFITLVNLPSFALRVSHHRMLWVKGLSPQPRIRRLSERAPRHVVSASIGTRQAGSHKQRRQPAKKQRQTPAKKQRQLPASRQASPLNEQRSREQRQAPLSELQHLRQATSKRQGPQQSQQQPRRRRKVPSFAGRLQNARTVEATLSLFSDASDIQDAVVALQQLALLCPRSLSAETAAKRVRCDQRLQDLITSLRTAPLLTKQRCTILWSLAMIFPSPSAAVRRFASELALPLGSIQAQDIEPHVAATTVWSCESLGVPVPIPLSVCALLAPFRLHTGIAESAFDDADAMAQKDKRMAAVLAMLRELPLRRDVIASGSANSSQEQILEDRGTCWFSDSGLCFNYSGKSMMPVGDLQGRVAAIRDAVRASLGCHYCSCLVNHYPDGGSGMRFHSDPGQGEEGGWGYSTSVVSMGDTRLFTFRSIDDPHNVRATFAVRHGDVLHMTADCQQRWQHSVVRERRVDDVHDASLHADTEPVRDRISLVFKRSWSGEKSLSGIEPPVAYLDVLKCLRSALTSGRWTPANGREPTAQTSRNADLGAQDIEHRSTIILANPRIQPTRASLLFPELVNAVFALEAAVGPADRPLSEMCAVVINGELTRHVLPQTLPGVRPLIVALGGRGGGEVELGDGKIKSARYCPMLLHDERNEGLALKNFRIAKVLSRERLEEAIFHLIFFSPGRATSV